MKILFIAPRFHTNQYYASKFLFKEGFEVHHIVYSRLNIEDHKYINFHMLKSKYSFVYIFKKIKLIKPEVVIIRGRTIFSILSSLICIILKIKSIRYEQVILENNKTFINKQIPFFLFDCIRKIQNFFLPKTLVTPIIMNFDMSIKDMEKRKRFFLPLPIEIKKTNHRKGKKIKILTVGKFEKRKNHLLTLQVFNKLKNKYDIELSIIGFTGNKPKHLEYYKKVIDFIHKNKLSSKVKVQKDLTHKEILKKYSNYNLFILLANQEEFGYSVLEAMGNGLPVIVSDDMGCQFLTNKEKNGFIIKKDNKLELKKKIVYFLENKKDLNQKSKNSINFVKKYYSKKKYIKQIKLIINNNLK